MRVAFFGLPLAALALLAGGHDIVWAAMSRREAVGTRRLARRIGPDKMHFMPRALGGEGLERLRDSRPDVLASWFFTKRIPAAVLRMAPSFGVHPSLLPRHRGPDPYFWAIDAGDETTGVTAHVLDEHYDTGAILAQRSLPIDSSWNSWRLARALDRPGLAMLRDVARAFAEGRPPHRREQEDTLATMAPEPTDDDLGLRWSWPARRIERRVRAAAPWPGAWTEIGESMVTLLRVVPTRDFPRALAAGEAAVRADGVAVVRAGDDALELREGRDEEERAMTADALAACVEAARKLSVAPGAPLPFEETR